MRRHLDRITAGLFLIGDGGGSPSVGTYCYYLMAVDSTGSGPTSVAQLWNDKPYVGWFLFLDEEIPVSDAPRFVATARLKLPSLPPGNSRAIVWLANADASSIDPNLTHLILQTALSLSLLHPINTQRQVKSSAGFSWWALALEFPIGAAVSLSQGVGGLAFGVSVKARDQSKFFLLCDDDQESTFFPPRGANVFIPIDGSTAGCVSVNAALKLPPLIQALGCGFRYVKTGSTPKIFDFPMYPDDAANNLLYAYNLRLHPLRPLDSDVTAFQFDLEGISQEAKNSRQLTSRAFLTPSGTAIEIVPDAVSGFAFNESVSASGHPFGYLSPVGLFKLVWVAGRPGLETTTNVKSEEELPQGSAQAIPVQYMPGVSGQEFITFQTGDVIGFEQGHPATSNGDSSGDVDPAFGVGEVLDATYTTSWFGALPMGERCPRYFAQPSASVYYGPAPHMSFPTAISAQLAEFGTPSLFPAVPYGYVTPADDDDADAYTHFENTVLTPGRSREILKDTSMGPRFLQPTPGGSPTSPVIGGTMTPQGLMVSVGDEGQWEQLLLARSPNDNESHLGFSGLSPGGEVSPRLGSALMRNELFLVISTGEALGEFEHEINMRGFTFNLDVQGAVGVETRPDTPAGSLQTIMIFKFGTGRSVSELVESPEHWVSTADFVGDTPSAIAAVQRAIRANIAVAAEGIGLPGKPFEYFNSIVNSQTWTGILALNCSIDARGMPADLQMLLGGVSGNLIAHHLGILINRVELGSPALEMLTSSIFGVIHYGEGQSDASPPNCPPSPWHYALENLTVLFANSNITFFNAKIGVMITQLFGREVELVSSNEGASPPEPNTIVINGQYQEQEGVATVRFSTDDDFDFAPVPTPGAIRLMEKVRVSSAALVPISSVADTKNPKIEDVMIGFQMAGEIWFAKDPFPNSDSLDLFSYGNGDVGLAYSGLSLDIGYQLDEDGAVPCSQKISFNSSAMVFTPSAASTRPGSLLASLPIKLTGFTHNATALTPTVLGATPVHCVNLESPTVPPKKLVPPKTGPTQLKTAPEPQGSAAGNAAPYVTTSPNYGLVFDMPLGTMGSLAGVHAALTAKMILAWGPSPFLPGSDAAAVFVQLPQVMGGVDGFNLQGILKTTFGDANLMKINNVSERSGPVYAVLFNNIALSVLGYTFPPGIVTDFMIFAGEDPPKVAGDTNLAWFLMTHSSSGGTS